MAERVGSVGSGSHFSARTFVFLRQLARNNDREWFQAHREAYDDEVREPALRFIQDFAPHLRGISPHFRADPRGSGGSLFRIHRDTRFSKDKSPFKTHVGIQFRHDRGRDAHTPGFYLHLEPGGCFAAAGIWHPDGTTLRKIREGLVENGQAWKNAVGGKAFRQWMTLEGERLSRPPRGFDPDHPLAEELKWKDFIAVANLTDDRVTEAGFLREFTRLCAVGAPLVGFLCGALDLPF